MRVGPNPVWLDMWFSDTHGHTHLLNSEGHIIDIDIEEAAVTFAEIVAHCSPDKHGERGVKHTAEEIDNAFKLAMEQLLTRNYSAEWAEIKFLNARYRLWNGPNGHQPVPEAIMMPMENGRDWALMVTGDDGLPRRHKIRKKVIDELNQVIGPAEDHNARRSVSGFGYEAKLSEKEIQRRRLARALARARHRQIHLN